MDCCCRSSHRFLQEPVGAQWRGLAEQRLETNVVQGDLGGGHQRVSTVGHLKEKHESFKLYG